MSDKDNEIIKEKWNLKSGAAGVGGSVMLMFMLQGRGIDLMNKGNDDTSKAIASRVERLENKFEKLQEKLDLGFDSLRNQLRQETIRLSDVVRVSSANRFTKGEQNTYSETNNIRLRVIENRLSEMRRDLERVEK